MDPALLLRALDFAARKHQDQRRKGVDASPYINHPIVVARLVAEVGAVTDPVTIVAAILHDTVEDTDTSIDEIGEHFGAEVAAVVAEVTDDKSLPKATRKRLQIEHAAHASVPAKTVKLADKTCNLIDIGVAPPPDWSKERQLEYLTWSEAVVAGCRGANPGLEARFDAALETVRSAVEAR